MKKRPKSNRAQQSRESIVDDLAHILRSPVSHYTKSAMIKRAISWWTEFEGKYGGCRYWTAAALFHYVENKKAGVKRHFKGLCHEHAVPKRVLRTMLLADPTPDPDEIRSLFEKLAFAVVVTTSEDERLNAKYQSTMPPEFHEAAHPAFNDPWLRYKRLGISVLPTTPTKEMLRDIGTLIALIRGSTAAAEAFDAVLSAPSS